MTKRTIPLYDITINVETFKESFFGYSAEELVDLRPEWEAKAHRTVYLRPALYAPDKVDHRYTPAELRAAYRWAASVIARLVLAQSTGPLSGERRRHGCNEYGRFGDVCGVFYEEGIAYTWNGEPETPYVDLKVPTDRATQWRDYLRRNLASMLTNDQAPLLPDQQPRPAQRCPDHTHQEGSHAMTAPSDAPTQDPRPTQDPQRTIDLPEPGWAAAVCILPTGDESLWLLRLDALDSEAHGCACPTCAPHDQLRP